MGAISGAAFSARFPKLAAPLDEDDLAALLDALELREAAAGEALVAEGARSADLFLVLDGELDIITGERRVARLEPGAMFGEVSLLDPGPAGAGVVTEQGATTLRLTRERLDELAATRPSAATPVVVQALASLSARLGRAAQYEEAAG